MIAQELEVSLHMAFVEARQQRHEFITVEHLLLALLDNPSASEVLKACAAEIDELRKLRENVQSAAKDFETSMRSAASLATSMNLRAFLKPSTKPAITVVPSSSSR